MAWVTVLVTAFLSVGASADEGFSTDVSALNTELQSTWNSTVKISKISAQRLAGMSAPSVKQDGSGVVVWANSKTGEAIVASNAHVAGCSKLYRCSYSVRIFTGTSLQQSFGIGEVSLVADFPDFDLSFLKIKTSRPLQVSSLSPSPESLAHNTPVWAIGYPTLNARRKGAWKNERPFDFRDIHKRFSTGKIVSQRGTLIHPNHPYMPNLNSTLSLPHSLTHDSDTLPGNSGGPLAIEDGTVVGINTGILNSPKDLGYCGSDLATQDVKHPCSYFVVPSDVILEKLEETLRTM